jgi:glycosyltransferase involved in cell wall biosynthesis
MRLIDNLMKIFLFSAVSDEKLFSRVGFYRDDIAALGLNGDMVCATNSIRKLCNEKADLVVCYFYSKSFLPGFISRIKGARVIFTGGADQISPLLESGYALNVRRVVAFFCLLISHKVLVSCKDDYVNFKRLSFGVSFLGQKIKLVPHVVVPSQIDRHKRKGVNTFEAFTLVWMGTISNVKRKGVDRAISLISILRGRGIDATLKIAGTPGPGTNYLRELASELAIAEHIYFLGLISEKEKNQIFATCDVYLQLSEYEGFGVAAAEAFFSGVTVAHSNVGGLKDVIGNYGIILPLSAIDRNDDEVIENFYSDYLSFVPNKEYLLSEVKNYSISARSRQFLGVTNVSK